MIAPGASTAAIVYDMFLVFGLSVGMWLVYHVICLLLRMKHIAVAIVVHLLFFAVAGFLFFCFILGQTESKIPRWHMVVGFFMGAWIYYGWFSRYVKQLFVLGNMLLRLLAKPFVMLYHLVKRYVYGPTAAYLQKQYAILYNNYRKKRDRQKAKRRVQRGGIPQKEQQKEPIRAYTQT